MTGSENSESVRNPAGSPDLRRKRADGVHSIDDLLGRCRDDSETGCLLIDAPKRRGTHYVWMPALGKPVALPAALALLIGRPLKPGQRWVPRCGETGCCNLAHRFVGTRSDLMRILRPRIEPLHRARIAAAHRKRDGCMYSPELRAEIMASDESSKDIGDRLGLHWSHICRIRRGEAWRQAAPTSSVFNLGRVA